MVCSIRLWINMFFWDPSKEIFRIPYLDIPIVWYGVFFACSFYVGYYLFLSSLTRYLSNFPEVEAHEVLQENPCLDGQGEVSKTKKAIFYLIAQGEKISSKQTAKRAINRFMQMEKNWQDVALLQGRKQSSFRYTNVEFPKKTALRLVVESLFPGWIYKLIDQARQFTDAFLVVLIASTIIGSRLFHLIFYERPAYYLQNPLIIFCTWKGGLASHGAALAIMIGTWYFMKRQKILARLSFLTVLDLMAAPAAFIGGWIRMGNFFNQEILGTPTNLPWAVAFGHPMDGSSPFIPRHPVQLYESFGYFFLFACLLYLVQKTKLVWRQGKLVGIFFTAVFIFRFFIERQSAILSGGALTMGQMLSIPFIFLGLFFYFSSKRSLKKKEL